jgi:hypothetical protein
MGKKDKDSIKITLKVKAGTALDWLLTRAMCVKRKLPVPPRIHTEIPVRILDDAISIFTLSRNHLARLDPKDTESRINIYRFKAPDMPREYRDVLEHMVVRPHHPTLHSVRIRNGREITKFKAKSAKDLDA